VNYSRLTTLLIVNRWKLVYSCVILQDKYLRIQRYSSYRLCCVELSYRSAVNEINDLRRKKALVQAHSQQAQETVTRIDEFTKQIQLKLELLAELRRYMSSGFSEF